MEAIIDEVIASSPFGSIRSGATANRIIREPSLM
jgi:hypothetical protein